jgi:hypothetical protein
MSKLKIPFLIISFLFILVLVSCATTTFVKTLTQVDLKTKSYKTPYFSNPEIDYVYKANITVYGNELSGIFIAKKTNDTTHRVVFTTEFGNKLLDFEISDASFKINAIVDELNRKILVTTLETDFRLLLKNDFLIAEEYEEAQNKVYQSVDRDDFNYLVISKINRHLLQIKHSTKRKALFTIDFTSENNTFAERIMIQHHNLKLKIELNYLKIETN